MNKNKWFLNGGRGSGRTVRLLCEVYENKIVDLEQKLEQAEKELADYQFNYPTIIELEKENAELKEEGKKSFNDWLDTCDKYGKVNLKLTKAKEIIKMFLDADSNTNMINAQIKAEQFLKELEK